MLIPRLLTAAILIAFAIFVIFFINAHLFYSVSVIFIAWLAWEWLGIIALKSLWQRVVLVLCYLVLYYLAFYVPFGLQLIIAGIWWLIALVFLLNYPKGKSIYFTNKPIAIVLGILIIIPTGVAVVLLRNYFIYGPVLLFYALSLVWVADSAAYFSGRKWGKKPLAPSISPKKTIEGLAGGILFSLLYAAIFSVYFQLPVHKAVWFIVLSIIAALFSVVGDLYISLLKRCSGLKDSGNFLPGHGGIFDRMDGVCAAVPIFALGLLILIYHS